jgi:cyclopropane fatty-acyl-phospholipid synthase-like methyltransferase
MDRKQLYDKIAGRKIKPKDFEPYDGNNGRVNRCAALFRSGKLRTGGTLLDVGGGIGDLGYAVRDLFDKVFTLDISRENLKAAAAKGNEIMLADVDHDGILAPDCYFDVVTALDFIEHIVDPEHFARECARVLKPSGEVFVNTPNIRFWKHIETLIDGSFPHTSGDQEVFHGGHLAFFTYQDLRRIFESAGFFSCDQIKDDEGYSDPPQWLITEITEFQYADRVRMISLLIELGCPNLLYKAVVKK